MIDIVTYGLVAWSFGLTILIVLLINLQANQADQLWRLRNDLNYYKQGHIFCKTVDKDFDCQKVKRND